MESLEFSWPQNTENAELMVEHSAHKQNQIQPQDFGSTASFSIVLDCLKRADHGQESVATLVVPRSSGYIVRSDIIPLRLIDCALVTNVVSFSKPLQFFDGSPVAIDNLQQLPNIFAASVGSMLLRSIDSASVNAPEPPSTSFDRVKHRLLESLTSSLERELRDRLSFPWLSMTKPKRQNLAIVEGGRTVPDNGGVGESIYTAAAALGIDMVVFENPGHWLQDARYAHWYKAFVSLKLELHPSANFTCDIVNAVRSYKGHLDGIVTFRDQYRPYVAEAALQLGLLTEPPSAYGIFTDKFKTSVSEGHHAYRASSIEQASSIVQEYGLDFPLITKPTNGFLSEGVFRIENLPQLEAGIKGININRHGSEFVIEKYCDGPEVDANVVLCDQKMIFIEVCDDFPKGQMPTAMALSIPLLRSQLSSRPNFLNRAGYASRLSNPKPPSNGFQEWVLPPRSPGRELKHGIRDERWHLRPSRALYSRQRGTILLVDRSQSTTTGDPGVGCVKAYVRHRLLGSWFAFCSS